MDEKLSQIFKNIHEIEPPSHLKGAILGSIKLRKKRAFEIKSIFYYSGFYLSAITAVYTVLFFGKSFLSSEFLSILTLLFSDATTIARNWQVFFYSLLETLPIFNIAAILVSIFALLFLFRLFSKFNAKKNGREFHISQYAQAN
jgi:hypothetical protein